MTDNVANLTHSATGAIAWLRNRLPRREREWGVDAGSSSRLQYQRLLLERAREVIANQSKGLEEDACIALILACIEQGIDTRDYIIASVPRHMRILHRNVAFLLDRKTGIDPKEHLWVKGPDQRYTILADA